MDQITIKEIAKICGVGVSTVSRAINDHPDINPQTKQMIMDTIREYHYVPNNSARNLKRSESRTIAVLVKGISNPFFGVLISVIEKEIVRKHYSFILQQVEEEEDEIEVAIHLEKEKRLKGIIFLGGMRYHLPERFALLTVPFVVSTVDMKLPDTVKNGCVVSIDDEKESRLLVEHLIQKGHRRIALLAATESDASIGESRLIGYKNALKEHGITFDPALVFPSCASTTYTITNGYEVTRKLIESGIPFTCIYAVSDTMAIGACRALLDAGLKVPADVSVAGFDGLDIATFYHPAITTMGQPREEIAQETVRLLFDLMKKKHVPGHVLFEAKLLEGESVREPERPLQG